MRQQTEQVRTFGENDSLPVVTKTITQEKINRYADASGDHNLLHLDPAFAATTQFVGTIAHGILVLAYVSEMMTTAFGEAWLKGGCLKILFRGAARPGDTVSSYGRVIRVAGGVTICV